MQTTDGVKFTPTCTIKMDNEISRYTEFVTVAFDNLTGEHVLYHYADVITAGVAFRMMARSFDELYKELDEEQRILVDDYFKRERPE